MIKNIKVLLFKSGFGSLKFIKTCFPLIFKGAGCKPVLRLDKKTFMAIIETVSLTGHQHARMNFNCIPTFFIF